MKHPKESILYILSVFFDIAHQISIYIQSRLSTRYSVRRLKLGEADFNQNSITFHGFPILQIYGKAEIGDNFVCRSGGEFAIGNTYSKIYVAPHAFLHIGKMSGISNTVIQCFERIIIGDYVNIGDGCLVFDTNFHSLDFNDRKDRSKDVANAVSSPVSIGDFAFIGARTIITKGVNIGRKSIVAAGSVVVCDIPEGEMWGGNPAKYIKKIPSKSKSDG